MAVFFLPITDKRNGIEFLEFHLTRMKLVFYSNYFTCIKIRVIYKTKLV